MCWRHKGGERWAGVEKLYRFVRGQQVVLRLLTFTDLCGRTFKALLSLEGQHGLILYSAGGESPGNPEL